MAKQLVPVIEAKGLTKNFQIPLKSPGLIGAVKHLVSPHYQSKVAVNAIDLRIEAGENVAYVGPNGAGKSTTIKMLTGVLVPSSGEIRVLGLIPYKQRVENAQNIGVVFGHRSQLWWDLPVQESLRLLGDIYSVPAPIFQHNLSNLIELLDLGPLLSIPTRQLSLGQRMRADIAASLLHSPSILYLDEPTVGLDVAVKARIRTFIKDLNYQHGVTVVLTSHDLSDIEELCERIVMIDKGKIVFDDSLTALKKRFIRERVIHIDLREPIGNAVDLVRQVLADITTITVCQPEPYQISIRFEIEQISTSVIIERLLPLLPIQDFRFEELGIESIIRQLYEGNLRL